MQDKVCLLQHNYSTAFGAGVRPPSLTAVVTCVCRPEEFDAVGNAWTVNGFETASSPAQYAPASTVKFTPETYLGTEDGHDRLDAEEDTKKVARAYT